MWPGEGMLGLGVIEENVQRSFDVFFDKGVLGAFVVLLLIGLAFAGLVIRFLYNEGRAREREYAALLERVVSLTEGVKNTASANSGVIEKLGAILDTAKHAIDELGHEIEKNAQENRHSMANTSMSLASIAEILKTMQDRNRGP